jgi:hypothetical protein
MVKHVNPVTAVLVLLLCLAARQSGADTQARYRVVARDARVELQTQDGRPILDLLPVLYVSYSAAGKAPLARDALPAPRRIRFSGVKAGTQPGGGWSVEAGASHRGIEYRLVLANRPDDPRIRTTVEIRSSKDLLVHQEVLRYEIGSAGGALMLDRGYAWRKLDRMIFTGSLTPHLARLGAGERSVWMEGGAGVQGLWLRPGPGGRIQVDVEIDHQRNHPFRVFAGCVLKPGTRLLRLHADETLRRAGSLVTARFDWVLGEETPVVVGRYPRGARAAIVFADHADQSNTEKLEAFAFGRTGALAASELGPQFPGFVNRGLVYTKTIFLRQAGKYAPQFEDPAYRRILDLLVKRGVEIGVHTPSGYRDRPEPSEALLREFAKTYGGRTWIDHQPDTNCEAVTNLGWRPFSRWYMLHIIASTGFRYLANTEDAPLGPGTLNLLSPEWPATRRPILYPSPRLFSPQGERFVQFSSTWLFLKRERLLRWFSDQWLDRLEAERGLLIGHVYFETFKPLRRLSRQRLLEPDGKGGLRLRPEVDALFVRLAERQARGNLWVTGVESLCRHLLGAMRVDVDVSPEGVVVRSNSPTDLSGLTLVIPGEKLRILVDGEEPEGSRQTAEGVEIWFDLAAGGSRKLQVLDPEGKPVRLVQPVRIELSGEKS